MAQSRIQSLSSHAVIPVNHQPINADGHGSWAPVKFFSKLNDFYLLNFGPINIFFDNKNKLFSGWPKRYFGLNRNTAEHRSTEGYSRRSCSQSVTTIRSKELVSRQMMIWQLITWPIAFLPSSGQGREKMRWKESANVCYDEAAKQGRQDKQKWKTNTKLTNTNTWWWWCTFLQQYRIHMDIGNSKNYLGIISPVMCSQGLGRWTIIQLTLALFRCF